MLKATGVVRKIDDLGRLVLPAELRRTLGLEEGTPMEIFVNDRGDVIIRKYEQGCAICGVKEGDHVEVKRKLICSDCRKVIVGPPRAR